MLIVLGLAMLAMILRHDGQEAAATVFFSLSRNGTEGMDVRHHAS